LTITSRKEGGYGRDRKEGMEPLGRSGTGAPREKRRGRNRAGFMAFQSTIVDCEEGGGSGQKKKKFEAALEGLGQTERNIILKEIRP